MFKKVVAENWFFDRNHGKLLYIFAYGNTFCGDGSDLLQFKVSLSYVPGNPGKFLNSTDAQDVMLVQVGE